MKLLLVHEDTNEPAVVGETLTDFRGETAVLKAWKEPYDPAENLVRGAKVYTVLPGEEDDFQGHWNQYYPSVFGLKFIVAGQPQQLEFNLSAKAWNDAAQRSW